MTAALLEGARLALRWIIGTATVWTVTTGALTAGLWLGARISP